MKFFKLICLAILTDALTSTAGRTEPAQYLCITDSILGYKFNVITRTWEPTRFSQSDKYVIRRYKAGEIDLLRSTGLPPATWGIFPVGEDVAMASCVDAPKILGSALSGILMCDGMLDFDFNKKSLRFQVYQKGHYTVASDPESKGLSPWIEIGKCSAM